MKQGGIIFVFALPIWTIFFIAGILLRPIIFFHVDIIILYTMACVSFVALQFFPSAFTIGLFGFCFGSVRSLWGDSFVLPNHTIFTMWRSLCDREFSRVLDEPYRTLVSGIIFGGSSGFSSEWKQIFRATGTTHLVAVSGANVVFVVRWIEWFFARTALSARTRFYGICACIGIFVLMTGSPASVVRAAIMAFIVHVASLIGRRASGIHALAGAAACMTLINPSLVSDIGFQFSCLATLGLIIFEKTDAQFFGVVAETIAATLCVLPLQIFYFHSISSSALIANVVMAPFIPLIMILGSGFLIVTFLIPWAAGFFGWTIYFCVRLMLEALAWIARMPGSNAMIQIPPWFVCGWFGGLFFYTCRRFRLRCHV